MLPVSEAPQLYHLAQLPDLSELRFADLEGHNTEQFANYGALMQQGFWCHNQWFAIESARQGNCQCTLIGDG